MELSNTSWSSWEVEDCHRDLERLVQSGDCAYDRPSIGVLYASKWNPRRTAHLIRAFHARSLRDHLTRQSDTPLRIIDLGCGAGAGAFALHACAHQLGSEVRRPIEYLGIDSSEWMLGFARGALGHLARQLPVTGLTTSFVRQSWTDPLPPGRAGSDTIIIASYLLDATDSTRTRDVGEQIIDVIERTGATDIYTVTTAEKLRGIWAAFTPDDEITIDHVEVPAQPHPPRRPLAATSSFRKRLAELATDEAIAREIAAATWWATPDGTTGSNLYQLSSTKPRELFSRRTWHADPGQLQAVEEPSGPVHISGAAGSGKSIVLVERIARVAQSHHGHLNMLVTTFNKSMVQLLATNIDRVFGEVGIRVMQRWSEDVRPGETCGYHTWQLGDGRRILAINRDRMRSVALGSPLCRSTSRFPNMAAVIDTVRARHDPGLFRRLEGFARRAAGDGVTTEAAIQHLLEREFERVIFALELEGCDAYTSGEHTGKRAQAFGRDLRPYVWEFIEEAGRPADGSETGWPLFIRRRHQLVQDFKQGQLAGHIDRAAFTHVFVDESQDFTRGELRLLAGLLEDSTALTMAGDQSQSIHLGPASASPRRLAGRNSSMHNMRHHTLNGSYRLPLRTSSAVAPLSEAIARASERTGQSPDTHVTPRALRSSIIGPRPIVVASEQEAAEVLRLYSWAYERRDAPAPICWLSYDPSDARGPIEVAAREIGTSLRTESVLTIKGLERSCVLIDDTGWTHFDEALPETLYAALTRSSSLMVIHLTGTGRDRVRALFGYLDDSHLMFWSPASRERWESCRALVNGPRDQLGSNFTTLVDDPVEA